ncbi:MAG: putative peptidoglycan glycosyltransferase FtsW [Aestuariivita sp.]|nr:putative peptidoglycan glycosyltransferase FtsW [Aestuariivita sp.]MCY4345570.1 putative peptidoglycan glycosyltransferase FtsW [Aestuariivita sp.]
MTEMIYGSIPAQRGEPILPKWWRTVDRWTLICVVFLLGIGLLLGLAATPPLAERNGYEPFHYVQLQFMFVGIGGFAMLCTSMMSPTGVRRFAIGIIFFLSFVAIIFLPVFGTDYGKGAVRWYSLSIGSVQPSEFLKPGFIVAAAWLLAASREVRGPPGFSLSFALCLFLCALLALQPDFGQACLLFFGWGVMYFVAGAPILVLVVLLGGSVVLGTLAYQGSEHFARRIDGFLNPEIDPTTQLGFAANAIREGGLIGVGVGEGQVKRSLPDAHSDFIIAVAAEEYGLLMVFVIITLYVVIAIRSLIRLLRDRDLFVRLAGTGLCAVFTMQAIINLSVAVRLLPAKGMTLPFISYGGSSLLASGLTIGMLLALTRTRPQGEFGEILRGKV